MAEFNASDHKQVKERERKEKQGAKQEAADLAAVLDTEAGRRFIWRLLSRNFQLSFNSNNSIMSFNEGERNASLRLWAEVTKLRPDLIPQMMREST